MPISNLFTSVVNALIVSRLLASMSGSDFYLRSLSIMPALMAPEKRGTFITIIGCSWGVGVVSGSVISGVFSVSPTTWGWMFCINLVIGASAISTGTVSTLCSV
ncbi:hypothetical protein TGAM01_v209597 [Trichoderma gamsii]|uniref:Major facilitator superfamily (MFS) profile domain-containing protein n=1 Tax=Trichoderma gamsii TaxID=398673 RepID=A0A2P4ZBC7_9HYPO|nr:hypothetical protein TGAM01_v209597 [Trichoderma gamsii]PON21566.1 hypothetical protein TGAM01_v209597 [Trichoderma gamsii]